MNARDARDPDWTDREAEGQPGTEDQPPGYDSETAEEGSFPPRDRPLVSEGWGTTPAERRLRESLDQRIARERTDRGSGAAGTHLEAADDDGAGLTVESSPPGASAEEAAVHVEPG